jgi:hypothetical protein
MIKIEKNNFKILFFINGDEDISTKLNIFVIFK